MSCRARGGHVGPSSVSYRGLPLQEKRDAGLPWAVMGRSSCEASEESALRRAHA